MRCGPVRFAFFCTCLLLIGCSRAGPAKGRVTGTVTLDGRPLETGTILFASADRTTPNATGDIKDGAYAADVPVGKMLVQISRLKVVGKVKAYDTPDSPVRDVFKEQVPAKYNVNTELNIEVKAGEQKQDFALKRQ